MDDMKLISNYFPFMREEQVTNIRKLVSNAEDFGDFISSLVDEVMEGRNDLLAFALRCCWISGDIKKTMQLASRYQQRVTMMPWYIHVLFYIGKIPGEVAIEKIRMSLQMIDEDWIRFEGKILSTLIQGVMKSHDTFDVISELSRRTDSEERYRLFRPMIVYSRGTAFFSRHELQKARENFLISVELADDIGDLFTKAASLNMLSFSTKGVNETLEILNRARDTFSKIANTLFVGIMENNIGFNKVAIGKYDEAIEHYHRAMELNKEVGNITFNPFLNIAVLYGNIGQIEKAKEYARKALEVSKKKDPEHPAPIIEMARALILSENLDEAYKYLETGGELAFKSGDDKELCRYYLVRGMWEMARGEHTSAVSTLKRGLRIADNRGEIYYILQLLLQLAGAEILVYSNQQDTKFTAAASIALSRLEQLSREQEFSALSAQILLLKSEIDVLHDDKEEARNKLEKALNLCHEEGMSVLESKIKDRLKEVDEKKSRKSLIERFKSLIRQIAIPFGEPKKTPFTIMGCIVILQSAGLEVYSKFIDPEIISDPSLIAGLISAVSNFTKEIRRDATGNLQSIIHQDIAVLLEHGTHVTCALLVDHDTYEARVLERRFLENFEEMFAESLVDFEDGAIQPLDASPIFHSIVMQRKLDR
ncbi:MAG: tetratricopeptide repeat protein [Candidatus Lokiarchaeota archaeon]|nr:tetratricopeptide repeat protein [Candidatus Lokiarchaeota archaeon]